VAYANGWTGLQVTACCVADHPMSNIQIVNNTFYDNGRGQWGGGIYIENPQAQGVLIRNNICSQNLTFQIAVNQDVPTGYYVADHNLIDGFRGDPAEIRGSDYVEGDPKFVNASAADFHLQEGSSAIEKGSPLNAPTNDYDGNIRPQGAGYDIGAYEYGAGSPPLETVSTPTTPTGQASGIIGTEYSFTADGAISSLGHSIEYRFDWGDGTFSDWSSSSRASKSWSHADNYLVRAQARCANHPSVESGWSDSFTVTISNVGPDLTGQWIVPVTQTCKNTSRGQKCTIKGTFTANNIGNRDASSAYVHFYLSDDDTYDEGDTQLKQSSTGKIKGGRGKSIKFSYSFPLGQIVTGKYIIAVIDKDNSVAEINETNNIITYGPIL
jgi:hypothetical protein